MAYRYSPGGSRIRQSRTGLVGLLFLGTFLALSATSCSGSGDEKTTLDVSGNEFIAGDALEDLSGLGDAHDKDALPGDGLDSGELDLADDKWDVSPDAVLPCALDQCDIEGICYENLEENPENSCQSCQVLVSRSEWTANDAGQCEDGDPCTLNERCVDGECLFDAVQCSDDNPCTNDLCDSQTGDCSFLPTTGECDDGNVCNGVDSCGDDGQCVSGTGDVDCGAPPPCHSVACEPAHGCVLTPLSGADCTPQGVCSATGTCMDGQCVASGGIECDDDNLCTVDSCDSQGNCVHTSVADLCVDDNPCTDEACDPAQGCVYPFNANPCDDANACTFDDTCNQGACQGIPESMDDLNPCTDDSCDPILGVLHEANSLPCEDGNLCTLDDVCVLGVCETGSGTPDCEDGNLCTDNECDPSLGCVESFNEDACQDGNECTVGDVCREGDCVGEELTCFDGNDCTLDGCDPGYGCVFTPVISNDCRPNILVDYPPRAATILSAPPTEVTVTGTVVSGAGPITSFTINGVDVPVDADSGAFSYPFAGDALHNTLLFQAEDSAGNLRERVQAYHWSSSYLNPDPAVPGSGMVDPGMGLWLSQETLDDGDHSQPINDLASVFEMVFAAMELETLIPSPAVSNQSISGVGIYNLYIQNLTYGAASTTLRAINGGLRVTATIPNVEADLLADRVGCGSFICIGGDMTGDMSMSSIVMRADLMLSVNPDHTLKVDVVNVDVTVNGADVNLDGILGFLAGWIIDIFIPDFVDDIEEQFEGELVNTLGPMLADALSGLAINLTLPLPRLDGALDPISGDPLTIELNLESDFSYTDFQADLGGVLGLRARATCADRGVPGGWPFDDNLGTPGRGACGTGAQIMVVPRVAPVEVVLPDDTLNELLHAAWWGGLLEFPVGPELLGDVDLETYGIKDLTMQVSALLPPLASDCATPGELRLHVGDLKITASLKLFEQPMDVVIYAAFDAQVEITTVNNELGITIQSLENMHLEVNVLQDPLIASESVIHDLILAQLMPSLEGMLGNGEPLASMPLPEIDLSSSLGLEPGSVVIHIAVLDNPDWPGRIGGNTIVYGQLQ